MRSKRPRHRKHRRGSRTCWYGRARHPSSLLQTPQLPLPPQEALSLLLEEEEGRDGRVVGGVQEEGEGVQEEGERVQERGEGDMGRAKKVAAIRANQIGPAVRESPLRTSVDLGSRVASSRANSSIRKRESLLVLNPQLA